MTRWFWWSLGQGWTEQNSPPPESYIKHAVLMTFLKGSKNLERFMLAEVRPPTEEERTLRPACALKRHGSIIRYQLLDEKGQEVYHVETSNPQTMKVFHYLAYQAAMNNWKVATWK